jgi:hypothetical protein
MDLLGVSALCDHPGLLVQQLRDRNGKRGRLSKTHFSWFIYMVWSESCLVCLVAELTGGF